ncbi:MAG: hypothetical protein V1744_06380 [Candidatus Altiarchaeota archaeon]
MKNKSYSGSCSVKDADIGYVDLKNSVIHIVESSDGPYYMQKDANGKDILTDIHVLGACQLHVVDDSDSFKERFSPELTSTLKRLRRAGKNNILLHYNPTSPNSDFIHNVAEEMGFDKKEEGLMQLDLKKHNKHLKLTK